MELPFFKMRPHGPLGSTPSPYTKLRVQGKIIRPVTTYQTINIVIGEGVGRAKVDARREVPFRTAGLHVSVCIRNMRMNVSLLFSLHNHESYTVAEDERITGKAHFQLAEKS